MTYRQKLARKRAGATGTQPGGPRTPLGGGTYGTGTRGGSDIYGGVKPGGGGAGHGGGGGQSDFHPWKILSDLDTNGVLSGKQLREGARALTALELRPTLHGYKQLAGQLGQQRDVTDSGIAGLATSLQGGVSDVYSKIAQSAAQDLATQQALAGRLSSQAGAISEQSSQGLQAVQAGQLGDYEKALEQRGAQKRHRPAR